MAIPPLAKPSGILAKIVMSANPFMEERKKRLKHIVKMLCALCGRSKTVERARFLALVSMEIGVSPPKAKEYIQTLINADYILANGPTLRPNPNINVD